MSAFVMSNKFFGQLAKHLRGLSYDSGNYDLQHAVKGYLGKAEPLAKVQQLANANIQAVNERYGEDEPTIIVQYETEPNWSATQLFKHLQCLGYQMSEGSVIGSAILTELNAFTSRVAGVIVAATPEYDKANWGGR